MTSHRDPDQPRGPRKSGVRRLLLLLWMPVAGALLALGGILLLAQGSGSVDVGWFAYAPLPEAGLPGELTLVSRSMQAGALLLLAGMVLLAFWGGLQAGRRRPVRNGGGPAGPDPGN